MTRRVVFWVSCVALFVVFACKSEPPLIPNGPSCSGYASSVLVINGHQYLYIRDADGNRTLVNLDERPKPGEAAVPRYLCPCELDECGRMCGAAEKQPSGARACLVGPHSHTHTAPVPQPEAPPKPATPPQP